MLEGEKRNRKRTEVMLPSTDLRCHFEKKSILAFLSCTDPLLVCTLSCHFIFSKTKTAPNIYDLISKYFIE